MNTDVLTRSDQATATLTIPGMGSDHCAGIVRTSLGRLAGVGEIRTSIASHRAEVSYDPAQVDAAALRSAVERAGYEVDALAGDAIGGTRVVRLIVPGMGSDHCSGIVSDSIRRLPGIADVSTNVASHRVRVRFDGAQTDDRAIRAAVRFLLHFAADPEAPERVFAATQHGEVLASENGGRRWRQFGIE